VTSARPASRKAFGRRIKEALKKPVRIVETIRKAVRAPTSSSRRLDWPKPEPILRTQWIGARTLTIPYGTMSAVELSLTDVMDKVVLDDWGQCRRGRDHVKRGLVTE
jgi:alanine dehydrogenase